MSAIANTFLAGSAVSAASTAPRARRSARRAAPATRAAAKDDADRLGPVEALVLGVIMGVALWRGVGVAPSRASWSSVRPPISAVGGA